MNALEHKNAQNLDDVSIGWKIFWVYIFHSALLEQKNIKFNINTQLIVLNF